MSLRIIKGGVLDTVQDLGRRGYQHLGINVGGVMDRFSAQLGNALLGKELNCPVLELHYPAPVIQFEKDTVLCVTGAHFIPLLDGKEIAMDQPLAVRKSSTLQFKGIKHGSWCYVTLLHDLKLDHWLGSYSTNIKAGAGGWKGRALKKGDELEFRQKQKFTHLPLQVGPLPWKAVDLHVLQHDTIDVLYGSEWHWLNEESKDLFVHSSFYVSPSSDRMGYQLSGESLKQSKEESLVSSAVSFGTIQLLPNGQLIVLMADGQTAGGYPRIAHVTSAHLPALAQLKPNQGFRFHFTDLETAEEKLLEQQKYLYALKETCSYKLKKWLDGTH